MKPITEMSPEEIQAELEEYRSTGFPDDELIDEFISDGYSLENIFSFMRAYG